MICGVANWDHCWLSLARKSMFCSLLYHAPEIGKLPPPPMRKIPISFILTAASPILGKSSGGILPSSHQWLSGSKTWQARWNYLFSSVPPQATMLGFSSAVGNNAWPPLNWGSAGKDEHPALGNASVEGELGKKGENPPAKIATLSSNTRGASGSVVSVGRSEDTCGHKNIVLISDLL